MQVSRRAVIASIAASLTGYEISAAAVTKHLDAALAAMGRLAASDRFYGVMSLGYDGRIKLARAYGLADIEAGRRAESSTPYGIASITKFLVSAYVLRLVDAGRLSLDAPITTWLKDYRADTGARFTLRHLLSNCSGIPNDYLPALRADPSIDSIQRPTMEAVQLYASGDLAFEPGAKFDYVQTNWIIVRAIIEAVTDAPFEESFQRDFLTPLKLTHTGFLELGVAPNVALPYGAIEPSPVRRPSVAPRFACASGNGYSTAGDLTRAASLLPRPGFLTKPSVAALTTVEVPEQDYTLGGRVKRLQLPGGEHRFAWQTGNAGGYKSLLAYGLDDGCTLTLLNNNNFTQRRIDEIAFAILGAWYGGEGLVASFL